jgi:hypothetical protein
VLKRVGNMLRGRNIANFSRTNVEIMGAEASYGARARHADSREVICRIAVEHDDKSAIELLVREQGTGSISMAPGHVGMTLGVTLTEVARVYSFLVPKSTVQATLTVDGKTETIAVPTDGGFDTRKVLLAPSSPIAPTDIAHDAIVPLLSLAWVRNGDKGDIANVAVIARRPEYLPYIAAALTPAAVRDWYVHHLRDAADGQVERFPVPGVFAFNFLLHGALDGGCTSSLRFDPLGKSVAQEILDFPVPVSVALARTLNSTNKAA